MAEAQPNPGEQYRPTARTRARSPTIVQRDMGRLLALADITTFVFGLSKLQSRIWGFPGLAYKVNHETTIQKICGKVFLCPVTDGQAEEGLGAVGIDGMTGEGGRGVAGPGDAGQFGPVVTISLPGSN
ncbi:MAG: hypothetical protein KDE04_04245 [Anaerolineales bacterium]|nr:hypothetical protein [Anaerolineales bacterium]